MIHHQHSILVFTAEFILLHHIFGKIGNTMLKQVLRGTWWSAPEI